MCRCLLIYTTAITVSTCEGRLGRGGRRGVLVEHVGDHFDFGFCCGDFLGGGGLGAGAAAEEEGHVGGVVGIVGGDVGECAC